MIGGWLLILINHRRIQASHMEGAGAAVAVQKVGEWAGIRVAMRNGTTCTDIVVSLSGVAHQQKRLREDTENTDKRELSGHFSWRVSWRVWLGIYCDLRWGVNLDFSRTSASTFDGYCWGGRPTVRNRLCRQRVSGMAAVRWGRGPSDRYWELRGVIRDTRRWLSDVQLNGGSLYAIGETRK